METTYNSVEQFPIGCLKNAYEEICNEYRRRLCDMWEVPYGETWWHGDKVGEGLFLSDWWRPLDIQELRYVVENIVTEKSWLEYCDFTESEIHDGRQYPRINFCSWFEKGLRPKDLKK